MEEKLTKLPSGLNIDEMGFIRAENPARDFDGLRLRSVLDAMRESSWDWPSAMFAIGGLDSELGETGDEPTMYPGDREIAWLKSIAPEENWDDFETQWDT
jgi:hypothetical protein